MSSCALPCVVFYADDPAEEIAKRGIAADRKGNCFHFTDEDGNSFQIVNPNDDHS